MKKRLISLFMVLVLLTGSFQCGGICEKAEAADSIYFAGAYKMVKRESKNYSVKYELDMQQYSSPEGKIVGNFTFVQISDYKGDKRIGCMLEGQLKKTGKNSYQYKHGKIIIKFKVYKKKVVIKQNRTNSWICNYSGTYLKQKAYSRP